MGGQIDGGTLVLNMQANAKGLIGALAASEAQVKSFGAHSVTSFAGMSKAAKLGMVGVVAGALAAVVGLAKLGDTFQQTTFKLRQMTGATGADLAKMEESFKRVYVQVGADAMTVAAAMGTVSQRTGAVGADLEKLTKTELQLARVTGGEVVGQIQQTTRMFGDWSIATADQSAALDYLYKLSQRTGVGITDLAQTVTWFGAPLRQLGFDFEHATAMIAKWEREGVNISTIFSGMRMALKNFARMGLDPQAAFQDVTKRIKEAGDAEAKLIGVQYFGVRAATDVVAAVKENRFALEDLVGATNASTDSIGAAADETEGLGLMFTKLLHTAQVTLEPIARNIMTSLEKAFSHITPGMITLIVKIGGAALAFLAVASAVKLFGTAITALKIVPLAKGLFSAVQGMGALVTGTWAEAGALAAMSAAIPWILAITVAVTAAVYIFKEWRKHSQELKAALETTREAAKTLAESMGQAFEDATIAVETTVEKVADFNEKNKATIKLLQELGDYARKAFLMQIGVQLAEGGLKPEEVQADLEKLAKATGGVSIPVGITFDAASLAAEANKALPPVLAAMEKNIAYAEHGWSFNPFKDISDQAKEAIESYAQTLKAAAAKGDAKAFAETLAPLKDYPETLNRVAKRFGEVAGNEKLAHDGAKTLADVYNSGFGGSEQMDTLYKGYLKLASGATMTAKETQAFQKAQEELGLAVPDTTKKVAEFDQETIATANQLGVAAAEVANLQTVADEFNISLEEAKGLQDFADDLGVTVERAQAVKDAMGGLTESLGKILSPQDAVTTAVNKGKDALEAQAAAEDKAASETRSKKQKKAHQEKAKALREEAAAFDVTKMSLKEYLDALNAQLLAEQNYKNNLQTLVSEWSTKLQIAPADLMTALVAGANASGDPAAIVQALMGGDSTTVQGILNGYVQQIKDQAPGAIADATNAIMGPEATPVPPPGAVNPQNWIVPVLPAEQFGKKLADGVTTGATSVDVAGPLGQKFTGGNLWSPGYTGGQTIGSGVRAGLSSMTYNISVHGIYYAPTLPQAEGGFLPQQATFQSPRAHLVQWAEPETGGEFFIPVAPAKRARSRKLWTQAGRQLGMLAYADGGTRGGMGVEGARGADGGVGSDKQLKRLEDRFIELGRAFQELSALLAARGVVINVSGANGVDAGRQIANALRGV